MATVYETRSERSVRIPVDEGTIEADLVVPDNSIGMVLFAHGSGSSRHSARNKSVAEVFQASGLATCLLDLLTVEEEAIDQATMHLRFNISLLAERLRAGKDWLQSDSITHSLPLAYFGASTGAAAALMTAAQDPLGVRAIVSRGGRPDLAGSAALPLVRAATLLIVGELDIDVLGMNKGAASQLQVTHELTIVQGATHLFEEPGALDYVAVLATNWFTKYLTQQ